MVMYNKYSDFNIPQELLSTESYSEDVNIVIGENGSGKSLLLSRLSDYYLERNYKNVIVVANSIHDKFKNKRDKRYHALKYNNGKKQTKDVLKQTLVNINKDSYKRISFVTQALEYVGFDARIGFKITFLNDKYNHFSIMDLVGSNLSKRDIKFESTLPLFEEIQPLIYKYQDYIKKANSDIYYKNNYDLRNEIFWFQISQNDHIGNVDQLFLLNFFKWEKFLVSHHIIKPIEVFLSKDNYIIPLLSASSGELSLITTIIYISSVIQPQSVIIIDEPENSLHPKWQREYVNKIVSLFYYYQPKIVIATHSPLVVTGAEINVPKTKVFKAQNFEFERQMNKTLNIEEVYYDLFDTIMPENRVLSHILVGQLNKLEKKEIRLEDFLVFLGPIYDKVTDIRQTKMLHGISELAKKIVKQRRD